MKWKEIKIGDKRVVKVFALLPIKNKGYWHWLEWIEKEQEYTINGWVVKWYDTIK